MSTTKRTVPDGASSDDTKSASLSIFSVAMAAFSLVCATVAIGFGMRAIDESKSAVASGPAVVVPTASLTEYAINDVTVAAGGSIEVVNDGGMLHNLEIEGTDLSTADLMAGESETLDISSLPPGTYTIFCNLPGHRDAGMEGTLTVTDGAVAETADGGGADGGHAGHDMGGGAAGAMDYQAMTDAMMDSMYAFPAETEGRGNELLEPTEVLADGTKVFDLVMEVAPWEVEPGKFVDAWTFNRIVPGPWIDLEVGDKVQVRVTNNLELATDVHWHGMKNDNANDGVAPYTQDLIEPGETYTYDVATVRPGVSMYHPHAHGHMLLPDGMFGVITVGDMPLPAGQTVGWDAIPADIEIAREIPMVLNDSGVIGYSLNGKSFPATEAYTGKVGDWFMIHYYNEGNQIHPMHLHQFDQIVIAKDGSPLSAPYAADTLNVAPGERYTVLIELDKPGTWVWHCHILPHVERDTGMFGMVTAVIVE